MGSLFILRLTCKAAGHIQDCDAEMGDARLREDMRSLSCEM